MGGWLRPPDPSPGEIEALLDFLNAP